MKELNPKKNTDNQNDNSTAALIHLSSLSSLVQFAIPIPFISILFPLILWQAFKNNSDYIDYHGKEAVNFNISFLFYNFILGIIALALFGVTIFNAISLGNANDPMEIINILLSTGGIVGILVAFSVIGILKIIFIILATVKAGQGYHYRYPMTIRFIK